MKVQSAVLAIAAALGMLWGACSSTGGNSSNGGGGTGGTSVNGGAEASCSNGTPCGGDVVGTWTVNSSCLKVTGTLDLMSFGAGCPTAPVTGSFHVTGTFTANSDGT